MSDTVVAASTEKDKCTTVVIDGEEIEDMCSRACRPDFPCKMPHCRNFKGDPALPNESIGGDNDPYTNPLEPHTDKGVVAPLTQAPTFSAPIFLSIESELRDAAVYTDATSFQIELQVPLHNVRSIEVVDFMADTVTITGAGRYFYLANGLVSSSGFTPQGLTRAYSSVTPNSVACNSWLKLAENYQNSTGGTGDTTEVIEWQAKEVRYKHYYSPELERVAILQFSLLNSDGTVLSASSEWSCTLMVTCKQ